MKVAGSSIESVLSAACGPEDLLTGPSKEDVAQGVLDQFINSNNIEASSGQAMWHSHTDPINFFSATGSDRDDYFKITCIRNPWDLCVSYYWWSIQKNFYDNNKDPGEYFWAKNGKNEYGLPALILQEDSVATKQKKFKDFLLCDWAERRGNIISCVDFLSRESNKFIHEKINYYIMFESLQKDIDQLSNILNFDFGNLPRLKSGLRNSQIDIRDYYSKDTEKLVSEKFNKIIDSFNFRL